MSDFDFIPTDYTDNVVYSDLGTLRDLGHISTVYVTTKETVENDTAVLPIPHTYTDATGYNEMTYVSNQRVIRAEYRHEPWLVEITYAMGGEELALVPALVDADDTEDVRNFLSAVQMIVTLRDDPVLDDQDYSELQWDTIEEAWDDYLTADIVRDLPAELFDRLIIATNDSHSELTSFIRTAADDADVHPEIEGGSVYIHAADITALECAIENRLEEMEK